MKHVWIVEMQNDVTREWEPTVGCALTLDDGRFDLRWWKSKNPDDKFKLTKYVPQRKR